MNLFRVIEFVVHFTSRPERLDEELTPTWLDNTEQEKSNNTENTLTLSPSLYTSDREASFRIEASNEKDKFKGER